MVGLFEKLSCIQHYRWASLLLLAIVIFLPVIIVRQGAPDWIAALPSPLAYFGLVAVTYGRLKDAGLSGGWVVLMLLALNFGPRWDGPAPLVFHASNLLQLVPIALGWCIHTRRSPALQSR